MMRGLMLSTLAGLLVAAPVVAQEPPPPPPASATQPPPAPAAMRHNILSSTEKREGWQLLFDGSSLDGWRRYDGEPMTDGWAAEDGTLTHTSGGRDIITEASYTDFELVIEWMVEPGGNSGVFYRAALGEEHVYHSAPEMQVLDDAGHRDGRSPLTSAGSNYGLYPAPRGIVRGAGEWNSSRIVVRGNAVEHWLNDRQIVEYEFGSAGWSELVANSKFNEWPAYGQAKTGHIGLQDHGNRVWYRNIKIRELR
jgi:3-keto-disaccharide hydrolase